MMMIKDRRSNSLARILINITTHGGIQLQDMPSRSLNLFLASFTRHAKPRDGSVGKYVKLQPMQARIKRLF